MKRSTCTKRFLTGIAIAFVVMMSGCASPPPVLNTQGPNLDQKGTGSPEEFDRDSAHLQAVPQANVVRPGYLYETSSMNDPGLGGKYRVDPDGKLRLSYGVVIDTQGIKEEELPKKIIDSYQPFLRSAQSIRVNLIQKKLWIDIRGLVNKAGKYLIEPDASLDEVLNAAGSLVANSQAEYVKIQSTSNTTLISLTDYYNTGNLNNLPKWQGGEIIFVQRKSEVSSSLLENSHPVVQLLGEVKTPGEIPYRKEGDFIYYLTKAGGPSAVANLSKVEIIRIDNGKRLSETYDWDQSKQIVHIVPGDVIIVHATQQTPLERTIQSGAGIAAILSAFGILIIAL